jgi:NAD(P)-dependent dehydrogenase (short-subunit alcohol dehydrogenase family)
MAKATSKMRVFITGTAGFIRFHLAKLLLAEGIVVYGFDGINNYYDVAIKKRRHQMLLQNPNFVTTEGILEDRALIERIADEFDPDVIIHLSAQANVRYSPEHPRAYLDANSIGTLKIMEAARRQNVHNEDGLALFTTPKPKAYDGVILAAARDSYRAAGAAALRVYGRPSHVFCDLKSVFARVGGDLRL